MLNIHHILYNVISIRRVALREIFYTYNTIAANSTISKRKGRMQRQITP